MSVFTSLLNNSFALSRIQRTPNGQGGWEVSYAPLGTVQGRLRPASATEVLAAQQASTSISHVLYVVYGADIQRGDRVEGGGKTVDVQAVREPSTSHEHLEVDCLELQFEVSTEEGGAS